MTKRYQVQSLPTKLHDLSQYIYQNAQPTWPLGKPSCLAEYIFTGIFATLTARFFLNLSISVAASCFSGGAFGIILSIIDRCLVYPYLLSPLRKSFPAVNNNDFFGLWSAMSEKNRGNTALQWFEQHKGEDAVRIYSPLGGEVVMPMSPAALRDVLVTHSEDYEKPKDLCELLFVVLGRGVVLTGGEEYQRHRKVLHPVLGTSSSREFQRIAWSQADTLCQSISDHYSKGDYVDPYSVVLRYTLDTFGKGILSYDFHGLTTQWDDKNVRLLERIFTPKSTLLVARMALTQFLPAWLINIFPSRMKQSSIYIGKRLRAWCVEINQYYKEQRESSPPRRGSLPSTLASGLLNDEEQIETVLTALQAGVGSTASAITWVLHLLTLPENAHYQAELRQELQQILSKHADEDIAVARKRMEGSPLLHGILEETLRLHPPFPVSIWEAQRDTTIAGRIIPKGTTVLHWMYAHNRNTFYWGDDAAEMNPYRWITVDESGVMRRNKHGEAASQLNQETFLHGPRSCVGKEHARASVRAAVAKIFMEFDVTRSPGDAVKTDLGGAVFTKLEDGLNVKFTPIGQS